ncbi:MAG: S46 family peptidase [Bacteroidetes bacterium]|nr:S46 family peptidase [Bacteroidota bacterium]
MKKTICTFAALLVAILFLNNKTDEGMFPLSELKNVDLQKVGLKMQPIDLYNPNGISLIDAIVRVGGCTGSFISEDGLIITNHHCAFSFVAAISDTTHDYINNGYLAKNRNEEAQAKGLVCKITASYEDVSSKVLQGTQSNYDPLQRLGIIASNIRKITDEENNLNKDLQCEVSEMFTGRTYVLFRYKLLKDVRLVYVPARSIGEYGGEKDNWVWPRHSGDFAILRAYVSPEGKASEFAINNVPYKPIKHLKVNPKGVKENDFVFVLGYPGRTFRHQPAAFYKYHEQYMLKYISELYDWQIEKMEEMSKGDRTLQIKYSSKIKSLANVTKNYKGKLQGFRRSKLTKQKVEDENNLQTFINSEDNLKKQYGGVIHRINVVYDDIINYAPRNLWYDQIYSIAPVLNIAATIDNYRKVYYSLKTDTERSNFKDKQWQRIKNAVYAQTAKFDETFEKSAIEKMMEDASTFNTENEIKAVSNFRRKVKDNASLKAKIMKMYAKTKLKDANYITKLVNEDLEKLFKVNDDLMKFATELNTELNFHDEEDKKREGELNQLMAKYVDAKSLFKQKQFIPDANATLRFTYGTVKGYYPNDADYNQPFTTLKGVIEKEDGIDYELLQIVKDLYASRDYGSLMHPDFGDLPINFLYNLDTTGGNSGSPVMNAYGELIGVNFDRAYTATINDYAWNESYSRSVGCDIRYILWVIQKVAKADYLIEEMGVKL